MSMPAGERWFNNSVGFNHEKHEAHEMMNFDWRTVNLMVTPKNELRRGRFLSDGILFVCLAG
jgi:hypothetical protein